MINGYIKIRVMKDGRYADCWQKVVEGTVVDHVDDDGKPLALPAAHEAISLTGQVHFAPNVLHDPAKKDEPERQPIFATPDVTQGDGGTIFKTIEPFGPGIGPAPEPAEGVAKG